MTDEIRNRIAKVIVYGYLNNTNTVIDFMLSSGKEAKPFEPYTGGKTSPSPEYSQEIISKEVSEIKVTGKNTLPFPYKLFFEEVVYSGITFTPLKDGGVKINGTSTAASFVNLDNYPYDKNAKYTLWNKDGTKYQTGSNSLFFGHDKNNNLIYINVPKGGITYNDLIVYPMETFNEFPTSYEPYKSQTVTLSQPITLRGLKYDDGNVVIDGSKYLSDVICEKDGVIGVERNFCEEILNEKTTIISVSKPSWTQLVNCSLWDVLLEYTHAKDGSNNISKMNILINKYNNLDSEHFYVTDRVENNISLFVSDSRLKTVDIQGAKEWLTQNRPRIIYQLEIPTFEPLPEQDQQAIKALKAYYPNTVIQTDCWNECEYVADPKLYIDKKLQPLNTVQSKLLEIESKV